MRTRVKITPCMGRIQKFPEIGKEMMNSQSWDVTELSMQSTKVFSFCQLKMQYILNVALKYKQYSVHCVFWRIVFDMIPEEIAGGVFRTEIHLGYWKIFL